MAKITHEYDLLEFSDKASWHELRSTIQERAVQGWEYEDLILEKMIRPETVGVEPSRKVLILKRTTIEEPVEPTVEEPIAVLVEPKPKSLLCRLLNR